MQKAVTMILVVCVPVAQKVQHAASNAKVKGSIPIECMI